MVKESSACFGVISNRDRFKYFLNENNKPGSNKASSYLRAIDLLCEMIERKSAGFSFVQKLWDIQDLNVLEPLYLHILQEAGKGESSIWAFNDLPLSYLRNGFCSAAIKQYHRFLIQHRFELDLIKAYGEKNELNSDELEYFESNNAMPDYLIDEDESLLGVDKLRLAKQRTNQHVFRAMVKNNYASKCCITGLSIAEINRASHIIGWAEDPSKRLDPRNGLYLSATYDAAFDRYLISLDDDYRVILSKELNEYYSNKSFTKYFGSIEGTRIELPLRMPPQIKYLEHHRNDGQF